MFLHSPKDTVQAAKYPCGFYCQRQAAEGQGGTNVGSVSLLGGPSFAAQTPLCPVTLGGILCKWNVPWAFALFLEPRHPGWQEAREPHTSSEESLKSKSSEQLLSPLEMGTVKT